MRVLDEILAYRPTCEQEEADRTLMLRCAQVYDDILTRENTLCHCTASAWVCDPTCSRVLMAYHNLYASWAWVGGHADGEDDMLSVALREAKEETGIARIEPLLQSPISLEALHVSPHYKQGKFVSAHLHLNLTYLLCADDTQLLRAKPDENSAVAWFSPEEAVEKSTEAYMQGIYAKLNGRLRAYANGRKTL